MRSLIKEHSYECLLAIIEMTQFRKRVYYELVSKEQRNLVEQSMHRRITEHFLDIPRECPKSLIVHGRDHRNDFTWIATAVFNKYVRAGSPYEVTIRATTRLDVADYIRDAAWGRIDDDDFDPLALYCLFDTVLL